MLETVLISGGIIVILAIIGVVWGLADPRSEIKEIKTNYLTLREHEEFVRRFNSDILRLQNEQSEMDKVIPRKEDVAALQRELDSVHRQISLLIGRSLIEPPPNMQGKPK